MFRPDFADRRQGFEQEAAAPSVIATVFVSALVGMNREDEVG
jgi:hypothetical protein